MVVRASPGVNSYIFAFVLPLSLLAVTTFVSIRIADKLDDEFLQEVMPSYFLCLIPVFLSIYSSILFKLI